MKKVLKYTGLVVLSLIVIIILIPILFKGKILATVKEEINNNLEARVEFKDLDISWFRHFPKLTLGLENVSIAGKGEFEGDTLLQAKYFDASVNVFSLFGDEIKVHGVYLESPKINAIVHKNGKANWEITKEDTSTATTDSAASFKMNLQKYEISDGYVVYNDEEAGMKVEIKGLNHTGSGDFNQDLFTLATQTKMASANFTYEGIPYLVNAVTGIDADFEINNSSSKYSFKNASLDVNDLKLVANGFFQLVNDSVYNMDLSFDAPSNDFKKILSLVPAVYKNEFDKVKTSGNASFKGFVKGTYSSTQLPAYNVDLQIKDGFFQYPDLPKPVKNIQVQAQLSNPDGVPDHGIVNIQKAHMEFGNDPFDFKLVFKNPETSKYIDLLVKGKLNLAEVSKMVKLDAGTQLAGTLDADAFVKGNLSALQSQSGPFSAGGYFNIREFFYKAKELPFPIKNGSFNVQVKNEGGVADATMINVSPGHVEMGEDVIDFTLQLDKPVTAVNFNGNAKGSLSLDKIQKFVTLDPGTSIKGMLNAQMNFKGSKSDIDKGAYENITLSGDAQVKNVAYTSKEYPDGVKISNASMSFNPSNAVLHNMNGNFQNTNFSASGVLDNMIAYALDKGSLKGNVNISADRIQLNDWMGTDTTTTTSTTSTEPFPVPANMDIVLNAKADEVIYDKVSYKNLSGKLTLKDETVALQNVQTDALGGQMNFNGTYSTRVNKKEPDISMNYTVKDLDIQKTFMAFNSIQKLMPIGKFLSGKMSSQFQMNGKLGADMYPALNSLTGNGDLLLIEGFLSKFQPLEKIAALLQVNALKDIALKDLKTRFEFANGKVLVKPFNVKVKDIEMQVGGTHGLDQSMDYLVAMKIPRSYLGSAGNNLVNGLAAKANQKGIPVTLSEMVDLNFRLTGNFTNPNVKSDLKQAGTDMGKELKQQATDFVQQKADSSKKVIADTLKQVKNEIVEDAKKKLFEKLTGTKDSSSKPVDSTKAKAADKVKGALNSLFKKKN